MFSIFKQFLFLIRGVKSYALVGPSGTGKSFRAKLVAQKYGIELIIDDGLLIRGDQILAGRSAKKDPTYLGAVKTALFDDREHREQVARALQREKFRKILVIGTSERMVQKICERLQLPHPVKVIKIEEIATKTEIEKAVQSRKVEGKHVIPVPALEVKRSYPSIFYDSVRVFLRRSFGVGATLPKLYEKSVVRPEYARRGRVAISEAALSQMVVHCVSEFDPNVRIMRLAIRNDTQGYRITIMLEVPFGTKLPSKVRALQEYIVDSIEKFTGILVAEVNIVIDRLTTRSQKGQKWSQAIDGRVSSV
ncbi:MAG TPA: AAA family ATPase [Rectinema sp.]|jgi:adenylate kinase family enzyme|nr:Asp23/Gls24 family envelope stress response protein [Spirochaetia bacterium]MDI9426574.1 AAA family ATPase [Spirochaetota bacterium]NLH88903.1 Asp23/Gls24 family envelope stress response protein [Treponema sp.]HNP92925.1 AAA family ATPase [Rectinema sp.]HNT59122.1 AAA family ATPase [Rectinema sp.]